MKKAWTSIKNSMKESIRTNTRFMPFKPGHEDVIKRSYKDFDVTKDFELRQKRFALNSILEKNLTQEPDYDNMSLDELENCYIEKTVKEDIEKQSDLNQKVLLTSLKKEVLLASISLKEFEDKNFEDSALHPKIRENFEFIHYQLTHNQPISKRILFESFPQFFTHEIGKLSNEERMQFPQTHSSIVSIEDNHSNRTYIKHLNNYLKEYSLVKRIAEMEQYIYQTEREILSTHEVFLKQAIEDWGWSDKKTYLYAIFDKEEENLTFGEKLIKKEYEELEHMRKELDVLTRANLLIKGEKKPITFDVPISKELSEIIDGLNDHIMKFKHFKLEDTYIIPAPEKPYDPNYLIKKLRKNKHFDIDEWIEKDNIEYNRIINSGLAIEREDPNNKSPESARKYEIVGREVERLPPVNHSNIPNPGAVPLDEIEESYIGHLPAEQRIHVNEYYKTLFLNEEDPKKYNFKYWKEYYGVDSITLRNIFNYVYFPVQDFENAGQLNRIIYFRDVEYEERREMITKMSQLEYDKYLLETEEKPELQEEKRLEYLNYVKNATEPRITERTVVYDDLEHNELIDHQLTYSENIIEIDRKIAELTRNYVDSLTSVKDIDPDIKRRIAEMEHVKKLENIRKISILEDKKKQDLAITNSLDQNNIKMLDEK